MSIQNNNDTERQLALLPAAFFGACPQCSVHSIFGEILYSNPASFTSKCHHCGLDYSGFNVGDGPAAFLTFIIGTLIVTLALMVELSFYPPFWVHILLWVPITIIMTIISLRVAKGALLIMEYRNRAREAVRDDVKDAVMDGPKEGNDA